VATAPALTEPRLTDRDGELTSLLSVLGSAPAVVLVEGEAGVGKSRLIQEALAARPADSPSALTVNCPPVARPSTLGPIADSLRSVVEDVAGLGLSELAGALRPLFPEWATSLPPPLEPAEDAAALRHRLFRAVAELLEHLDVGLLVVDDVHWADEASLEFLLFLTSRPGQRISLLLGYRPEEVPPDSLLLRLSSRRVTGTARMRVSLDSLDRSGVHQMVSSMLSDEPIPEELVAFLHSRTGGLPLAVEESVRLMCNRADLTHGGATGIEFHRGEFAVPPTVRDAVLERCARLSEPAQRALNVAAVLADPTAEELVLALMGSVPEKATQLQGLADAVVSGLVTEDSSGLVSFRHMVSRLAVYEAIPAPQRRDLHGRAGAVLEAAARHQGAGSSSAGVLARHFREAGHTTEWRRYAEQAADLAIASGDDATAVTVLHDVVTEGGPPAEDVARLVSKMPLGLLAGRGRLSGLATSLRATLSTSAPTPAVAAEIRFQLARILQQLDAFEDSRVEMEKALPGLDHDPVKTARAMMFLGLPYGTSTPAVEHLEWLRRAAEVPASADAVDRLNIIAGRASGLLLLGEDEGWEVAARVPTDADTTGERLQIAVAKLNVGHMALVWGRYPEARRVLAEAIVLCERYRFEKLAQLGRVTMAHADWLRGEWDGLEHRAAELSRDEELLQPVTRLIPAMVAGSLAAARGESDAAAATLRSVLDEAYRHGGAEYAVEPAGVLARLRLGSGHVDEVLELTDGPLRFIASKGTWIWATDLVPVRTRALLVSGQKEDARRLVAAFEAGVRDRSAPGPHAAVLASRALLAQHAGHARLGAELFGEAALAWAALPRPHEALLNQESRAASLLEAHDPEGAGDILDEAFHGLSALGARGDAVRVMHSLRALGRDVKRPAWLGGRRTYGDQLSPRELDVVRELVSGATNREIAHALTLSPKTVARHLEAAMRKLDVTSRTALAVKAVEAGLVDPGPGAIPR